MCRPSCGRHPQMSRDSPRHLRAMIPIFTAPSPRSPIFTAPSPCDSPRVRDIAARDADIHCAIANIHTSIAAPRHRCARCRYSLRHRRDRQNSRAIAARFTATSPRPRDDAEIHRAIANIHTSIAARFTATSPREMPIFTAPSLRSPIFTAPSPRDSPRHRRVMMPIFTARSPRRAATSLREMLIFTAPSPRAPIFTRYHRVIHRAITAAALRDADIHCAISAIANIHAPSPRDSPRHRRGRTMMPIFTRSPIYLHDGSIAAPRHRCARC